jgi:apolipoprotein N-acyltransferase
VTSVAWNFLRGRFFVRGNVWDAIGWTLVGAPILIVMLETMGRNGVTAALGIGEARAPARV